MRGGAYRTALRLALSAALLTAARPAGADDESRSPLAGSGLYESAHARPYTDEERAELDELGKTLERFEEDATGYRDESKRLIEHKYKQKRDVLYRSYETLIVDLEKEQRTRRDSAITKFEGFVQRYPDDPRYTPDAMFRLSELYFERSYDVYFQARQLYDKAVESAEPGLDGGGPIEPSFHYEPTIAMMQRLIVEFPQYRLLDGAYYLLGYCLGEQGEEERAVDVYHELVARRPDSKFSPEVWTRIGEYYFDSNELERALHAYTQVLGQVDSPFYDKAIYKLAWTHYRLADPERSPEEFQKAVDTFVQLLDFNERTRKEGKERGGDLRKESIQYIAISYADEQWGGTQKMVEYFQGIGTRPYEREVYSALGDVYFDQTRFDLAVEMYNTVQSRYPDDPEAPVVQEKIITAHERNRNFEGAAAARELLTRSFSEGSPWFEKNKDDEEAVKRAKELTEKSLYSAALFHHKQAQIHRSADKIDLAKAEYGKAAEAYGEYLRRFPHDRQLYELTFYWAECLYYSLQFYEAAAAYTQIRDSNVDNKFLEESAFSVILSWENAIKLAEAGGEIPPVKVVKSSERTPGAPISPQEIPAQKRAAIEASDKYAAVVPNSEKIPKIAYKAAEIFYSYDHLEEARRRFESLLQAYPQHEVAEYAANLVIESYLSEQNFDAVEKFSRSLLERPSTPGRGQFKGELVKFKTGAMFKIAEDLQAKGDDEAAALLYLKMLDENPHTEFADSALNNAAVAYEAVRRYDSATKLYERLVRDYPKSPLADTALFRVGVNAERFFAFDRAIEAYTALVDKYPKSEKRADAIYNAALSLENTQEYERSAQMYQRYCKLFPKRDDAPAVCFRAGAVYEKMGDPPRVISTFQTFIRTYKGSAAHRDRIIEAHLRIAKAHEKQKREKEAAASYKAAVDEYKKVRDDKSALYAAEAQFQLVERQFARFAAMKFTGTSKQQAKAFKTKNEELKKVGDAYRQILNFKQIEWTLAALFRIGQLYQNLAETMIGSECPTDVRKSAKRMGYTAEEVCDETRVALEEAAAGIEDKAVAAYEATITRAREFQVANKWTKRTLVALNKLRRAEWPLQKDAKVFVDEAAVGALGVVDKEARPVRAVEPAPPPEPAVPDAAPEQPPAESQSPAPEPAPAVPVAVPEQPAAESQPPAPGPSQAPAEEPPPPPPPPQ